MASARPPRAPRAPLVAALAALALPVAGCPTDDEPPDETPRRFSVVALPDTQIYSEDHPELFEAQTRWIADHADELSIQFVTHLGDVVDNGPDVEQWENARAALDRLDDAGVRWGVAMGNHDNMYSNWSYSYGDDVDSSCSDVSSDIDCDAEHFREYVGPDRFDDRPWFGGASPSGLSSYQRFEHLDRSWLFLHLRVDPGADEREWAAGVLADHPDALVHVSTHRYLYDYRIVELMPEPLPALTGGHYNTLLHSLGGQELIYRDAIPADELFETLIAPHENVYMVQCGHVDAEYRQQTDNEAGQPVFEILTDFQTFHPQGGDGWLKLLTYDLDAGTIHVQTYSPHLDAYRANGDGLDVSLDALGQALDAFGPYLASFGLDLDELEELLTYWTTTDEGRAEYLEAAYGDGQRDSDFVLEVDFDAYVPAG